MYRMQGRLRAAKNKQKFKQNKKGKELLKIMLKKKLKGRIQESCLMRNGPGKVKIWGKRTGHEKCLQISKCLSWKEKVNLLRMTQRGTRTSEWKFWEIECSEENLPRRTRGLTIFPKWNLFMHIFIYCARLWDTGNMTPKVPYGVY